MVRKPDATMQPTPHDNQLMSKHRVLSLKPQLRLEWRGQDGQNETEQPDHSASLGDSITSSTRITLSVHTGSLGGSRSCAELLQSGSLPLFIRHVAATQGGPCVDSRNCRKKTRWTLGPWWNRSLPGRTCAGGSKTTSFDRTTRTVEGWT